MGTGAKIAVGVGAAALLGLLGWGVYVATRGNKRGEGRPASAGHDGDVRLTRVDVDGLRAMDGGGRGTSGADAAEDDLEGLPP